VVRRIVFFSSKIRWTSLVATFAIMMWLADFAHACPNCKEGLVAGGAANAQQLARGFELSIYLMLGMPVLIFSSLCGLFYVQVQRAKRNPDLWRLAETERS
jgi:hypothetical protein